MFAPLRSELEIFAKKLERHEHEYKEFEALTRHHRTNADVFLFDPEVPLGRSCFVDQEAFVRNCKSKSKDEAYFREQLQVNQLEFLLNQKEYVWNDPENKDFIIQLRHIPGQNGQYC